MSASVNKVILQGNLGQDPELRYTGAGTAVCNFRMATNESYKDANGERVNKTTWHSLVAWGRNAEVIGENVRKGDSLFVDGVLQTRSYEDKEDITRHVTEIKVLSFQFNSPKQDSASPEATEAAPAADVVPDDELPF